MGNPKRSKKKNDQSDAIEEDMEIGESPQKSPPRKSPRVKLRQVDTEPNNKGATNDPHCVPNNRGATNDPQSAESSNVMSLRPRTAKRTESEKTNETDLVDDLTSGSETSDTDSSSEDNGDNKENREDTRNKVVKTKYREASKVGSKRELSVSESSETSSGSESDYDSTSSEEDYKNERRERGRRRDREVRRRKKRKSMTRSPSKSPSRSKSRSRSRSRSRSTSRSRSRSTSSEPAEQPNRSPDFRLNRQSVNELNRRDQFAQYNPSSAPAASGSQAQLDSVSPHPVSTPGTPTYDMAIPDSSYSLPQPTWQQPQQPQQPTWQQQPPPPPPQQLTWQQPPPPPPPPPQQPTWQQPPQLQPPQQPPWQPPARPQYQEIVQRPRPVYPEEQYATITFRRADPVRMQPPSNLLLTQVQDLRYRLDIIESAHRSDIHSGIQPFPYDPYNQGHSGDHTSGVGHIRSEFTIENTTFDTDAWYNWRENQENRLNSSFDGTGGGRSSSESPPKLTLQELDRFEDVNSVKEGNKTRQLAIAHPSGGGDFGTGRVPLQQQGYNYPVYQRQDSQSSQGTTTSQSSGEADTTPANGYPAQVKDVRADQTRDNHDYTQAEIRERKKKNRTHKSRDRKKFSHAKKHKKHK